MDKKSLLQAVKAVGGKVFVDKKDYTVYMIPENQEVWFYEMREKIGFNNLFHGNYGSSDNLSFTVYWDQPEFSEDDNNIEYFLQTANTELLVNLLINDPAKNIIKTLTERGVDVTGKQIGFENAKRFWKEFSKRYYQIQ